MLICLSIKLHIYGLKYLKCEAFLVERNVVNATMKQIFLVNGKPFDKSFAKSPIQGNTEWQFNVRCFLLV